MNDVEYLGKIVESIKMLYADEYVMIFNSQHQIVYVTNPMSKLILGPKAANKEDLLHGKAIHELPHPIASEKHDYLKTIMPRPREISLIMVDQYFNEDFELIPGILAATNKSIINPDTENIVGFLCSYTINPEFSVKQLHTLIDHANFELTKADKRAKTTELDLTPRQQHVLVLILKNMSAKEIAAYLSEVEQRSISHMTIHNIINGQLFKKFEVMNIHQLQQKVFSSNYHHKLIQSLLFKQLILIS